LQAVGDGPAVRVGFAAFVGGTACGVDFRYASFAESFDPGGVETTLGLEAGEGEAVRDSLLTPYS